MIWADLLMNEFVWTAVAAGCGWVWGKISGRKYAKDVLDWALPMAELVAGKTANKVDDKAVAAVKAAVTNLPTERKQELRDMLSPPRPTMPRLPK